MLIPIHTHSPTVCASISQPISSHCVTHSPNGVRHTHRQNTYMHSQPDINKNLIPKAPVLAMCVNVCNLCVCDSIMTMYVCVWMCVHLFLCFMCVSRRADQKHSVVGLVVCLSRVVSGFTACSLSVCVYVFWGTSLCSWIICCISFQVRKTIFLPEQTGCLATGCFVDRVLTVYSTRLSSALLASSEQISAREHYISFYFFCLPVIRKQELLFSNPG